MVAPASPYDQKFADFIRMLSQSKEEIILIHHPQVIGDTYHEHVESLNRLADAKKRSPFRKAIGKNELRQRNSRWQELR